MDNAKLGKDGKNFEFEKNIPQQIIPARKVKVFANEDTLKREKTRKLAELAEIDALLGIHADLKEAQEK